MSAEANQDQKFSRDAALIALAHARDRMAGPDDRLRPDKPSDGDARSSKAPATLSERSVGGGISIWRLLVGLGALVPVGTVVLAWHLLTRQGAEISFSTASVSKELVVKAPSSEKRFADNDAVAPKKSVQMEPPSLVSTRTEQAQSIASMSNSAHGFGTRDC